MCLTRTSEHPSSIGGDIDVMVLKDGAFTWEKIGEPESRSLAEAFLAVARKWIREYKR